MPATCLLVLFLLLGLPVSSAASVASDPVPYDRLQQKSVHNAYQRKETLGNMLADRGLRSLELDIAIDKFLRPQLAGDWYVYHSLVDSKSSVDTLRQGLRMLQQFHVAQPQHEVVTLWMDIKQKFQGPTHRPEDLDQLFDTELGDALFAPADLVEACPGATDLQSSVQSEGCRWPTAEAMRGRILIVLTEAPNLDYIAQGSLATSRRAFIAPRINRYSEAIAQRYAVFFNFDNGTATGSDLAQSLARQHLVSRTWDLNDKTIWAKAVARGVNHLATNKVDASKDPWSTTHQADGGYFAVLPELK